MSSGKVEIKNFHPHSVTGKADDSFVGLKIKGGEIHFYYPETFSFDERAEGVRSDIIDLLRSISLAKTNRPAYPKDPDTEGDFVLYSYLWIIKDFLANGFYVNRERIYRSNQCGRVDWKRTMQTQPIVSDGNIIYPKTVVSVKNDADNLIVEIHKYCVKKSINFIGWLFNLSSDFIETKPFGVGVKRRYVFAIKGELDRTFEDGKRMRLKHMLNVILGLGPDEDGDEFIYGVDSYHYIFERMVDEIFGNVSNMRSFNPTAKWQLERNDYRETRSSDLRPDTVILRGRDVFILDSKYYRFGFTGEEGDLPETTSIQKQITYGDYIKKNAKVEMGAVYSAFLIPFDKTREVFRTTENLKYIGFAKSAWRENRAEHELIHAFLIDFRHVLKTWNKFCHSEDVDKLVGEIISHHAKAKEITSSNE